MKFTCTKENLSHILGITSPIASKQSNLPILMNLLITVNGSKVEFAATNLEIAVKASLRAKIDEPGTFTVPAKTLFDYVNLLTDEQVSVCLNKNELVISCGSSSTKIKGAPADEFPVIPEIEEKHMYVVNAAILKSALSKTVIAAAKNEIRPELSGVFAKFFGEKNNGLVLAATDSYRLAETKISVDQGSDSCDCIIPSRTVFEIIRLISLADDNESNARLFVSDNQIAMCYNGFEMTSRLVDGVYPDYTQIIPSDFKTSASFPVDVMINKIKAAGIFTTTGINAVSFDLNSNENNIGVSSTSTQTGEHDSRVDSDVVGEENSILLNHRYVLDGLQQMEGDVEFNVNGNDSPCLFRPKGKNDYLYIVMPIRQ